MARSLQLSGAACLLLVLTQCTELEGSGRVDGAVTTDLDGGAPEGGPGGAGGAGAGAGAGGESAGGRSGRSGGTGGSGGTQAGTDGGGGDGASTTSCASPARSCADGTCAAEGGCCESGECPEGEICTDHVCQCEQGARCDGVCRGEGQCCADTDCPTGASCTEGACSCPEGTHACGSACADSASPETCGQSCDPCLAPEGGGAECVAGECVPTCPQGQRPCAGTCIAETMACTGQCPDGSHDCSGVCVPNDSVNGCGTQCTACPVPQYGTATCDGTSCDFTCDGAHKRCGSACIALSECCDSGECPGGSSCVNRRCTCATGQRTCGSGAQLRCVSGNCCGAADCQPSATCSAASMCDCAAGQVRCGSGNALTCWPAGSCCSNADCGNGFACVSGECRSFCEQQTRPAGVAANDYQCLDFDRASALPWSSSTAVSGTIASSTSRASSLPRSLRSSVNGTNDSAGRMSWMAVGGEDITGATLSLRILPEAQARPTPPFEGYVDVLCMDSSIGYLQCLSYTNQGTLYPIDGPLIENYTGYFMRIMYYGGAALLYDCPLDRGLTASSWNTVELSAVTNGTLRINGQDAGGCIGAPGGTATTFTLGLEVAFGAVGWVVYYDDVVISVRR